MESDDPIILFSPDMENASDRSVQTIGLARQNNGMFEQVFINDAHAERLASKE